MLVAGLIAIYDKDAALELMVQEIPMLSSGSFSPINVSIKQFTLLFRYGKGVHILNCPERTSGCFIIFIIF